MKKSKASRIKSFVDLLYQGVYYLSDNDKMSLTQLLSFDPTTKDNSDDLIDVESYGTQMLSLHLDKIKRAKRYNESLGNSSQIELLEKIAELSKIE